MRFLVLGVALVACGGSRDKAAPAACAASSTYPEPAGGEPRLAWALPDATLDGLAPDGSDAKVAFHDFYEPCAAAPRLLVIRIGASWCGTCRWQLAHTRELRAPDVAERLRVLDLTLADEDNAPATRGTLQAYRRLLDEPHHVAADPSNTLGPLVTNRSALPIVVLVDTRTMVVKSYESNPTPERLADRIRAELAELDGKPKPTPSIETTFDGRFARNEWDMLHEMRLPGAPPPDPTNAKADDPRAAELGRALFSEKALSPGANVSCATCHDPAKAFADGVPQSNGVALVDRNAPSVTLASHARWQFWDGRADSLWMQALGPLENDKEFASSRLFVVRQVYAAPAHRSAYETIFGGMPALQDAARFPASGKPGDAAWEAMRPEDRVDVTRAFVNVGKAIAAFERTLRVGPTAFDRYVAGDLVALDAGQKAGLSAFFKAGCAQCHYGPRLTDDAFHAIRFPSGRQDRQPDSGRFAGLAALRSSEFHRGSEHSEAREMPSASLVSSPSMLGAFKTPTLREIADTAPYGHGGTFKTLEEIVKHYAQGGVDGPPSAGESEPWVIKFEPELRDALPAFLRVLKATPVQ